MWVPSEHYHHNAEEILSDYQNACDWLTSLGLKGSRSRYTRYKKRLDQYKLLSESKDEELVQAFIAFCNAYLEANELMRIHSSFSGVTFTEFEEQIRKAIKGSEFPKQADSSRDFLFELSTATRFMKAGFTVELSAGPDVLAFPTTGYPVIVECKRLQSPNKITRNIKKARKQICDCSKRLGFEHFTGLIAVDMTELMPKTELLFPPSVAEAENIHRAISSDIVLNHQVSLDHGKHPRIMGILCQTLGLLPVDSNHDNALNIICRGGSYYPYREQSDDWALIKSLGNQDYK